MIKRTLYFSNPAYLSKKDKQLVIEYPAPPVRKVNGVIQEGNSNALNEDGVLYERKAEIKTVPIEDIGVIVLDNQQITISHGALMELAKNNAAVITCDETHHPTGLLMPLDGNTTQSERFQAQIEASVPLKKNLWQQTIETKIYNQACVLKKQNIAIDNMLHWSKSVKSGDGENHEARAAAYYWANLFPVHMNFRRERFGQPPNNLLNYGYAVLRAIVARSLVASGLLPTLGIFHRNKYNAYCLADDIMEPYRPFVDKIVLNIIFSGENYEDLSTNLKKQLLQIPVLDIIIDGERSPLMVGMQRTTASLARCFEGVSKKILYPEIEL